MRMQLFPRSRLVLGLAVVAGLAITWPGRAAEKLDAAAMAKTVAPFVDNETIAVAHVDLSRISPAPIVALLTRIVPDAEKGIAQSGKEMAESLNILSREQVTEFYAVVSLGGGSVVPRVAVVLLPAEAKRNLEAVRRALSAPPEVTLVEAKSPPAEAGAAVRPELADAFAATDAAAIQIALIPPASSRRVIEEIMPQLPKEAGGGPSTIVTHGVSWAAAAIDLAPELKLRLAIKSQDAASAEALRAKWLDLLKHGGSQAEVRNAFPEFDKVTLLLTPKLSGDHLAWGLDEKEFMASGLLVSLQQAAEKARGAASGAVSMNNLKQIALAMHMYYDVAKHLPQSASRDANGKPLLSWRVAILPYIEQGALYKEFHLDEPWDSPHNKPLAARMPPLFRSPYSKTPAGMTNYVVPVGGGALYSSAKDEPTFKEITDGASQTIMVVNVDDQHAVVWTKPDDLPFDPQDPKKGIGGMYREGFPAAFCDGSVRFLPAKIDATTLKALFTRAGGETIGDY